MNALNLNLCGYSIEVTSNNYETLTKWGAQRFAHDITVKVAGKRTSFKYYTSQHDFEHGNDTVNLQDALYAYFSDAGCYADEPELELFAVSLGYEIGQLKELLEVYKGCKKAHTALARLFGEDFYNVYNALIDLENER